MSLNQISETNGRYILNAFNIGRHWQALHLQGPSQFLINFLKVFKFSADFSSFGRLFQICGVMDIRLLDPKVVWFGLILAKSFGFCKE